MMRCFQNKYLEEEILRNNEYLNNSKSFLNKYIETYEHLVPITNMTADIILKKIEKKMGINYPNVYLTILSIIPAQAKNGKPMTGLSCIIDNELHIIIYDDSNKKKCLIHELLHYYVYLKHSYLSYSTQEEFVLKLTDEIIKII